MSENRATTNADMYKVLPRLAGDIASGRWEETRSFSQENHKMNFSCEKEHHVPRCRRRIGLLGWSTDRNRLHRVTRVNYTCYAVTDLKAYFASGRAEDPIFFYENFSQREKFLVKKNIMYHAAAGESGLHRVKRSV